MRILHLCILTLCKKKLLAIFDSLFFCSLGYAIRKKFTFENIKTVSELNLIKELFVNFASISVFVSLFFNNISVFPNKWWSVTKKSFGMMCSICYCLRLEKWNPAIHDCFLHNSGSNTNTNANLMSWPVCSYIIQFIIICIFVFVFKISSCMHF